MTTSVDTAPGATLLVQQGRPRRRSWLIIAVLVAVLSTAYGALTPDVSWSFLLAISVCGALIGVDAVSWLTTRTGTFDPIGLVGLYGLFFFYLAPMLTVGWLQWPAYLPHVRDLQGSFAALSWLYVIGLLAYRLVMDRVPVRPSASVRRLDVGRLKIVLLAFAGLAAVAYIGVIMSFGGPAGYYSTLTQGQAQTMQALRGYGPLITAAAWLPMCLFAVLLVTRRDALRARPWLILAALAGFLVLTVAIDGLRGSRGAVVWPLLIAVGLVHYLVRSIPKIVAVALVPVLFAFMFVYGIYKTAGSEGLSSVSDAMEVVATSNRTLSTLLVGDFARTTTQVLTYEGVASGTGSPAWGATYLGDLVSFIPGQVLSGLPDKVAVGAQTLGVNTPESAVYSLIYGMSGEGMLNFGLAGAVIAFAFWIPLVRVAARVSLRAGRSDIGAGLLAPGLALLSVFFLFNDVDNCVTFVLAYLLPLLVAVALATRREHPVQAGQPDSEGE